MYEPIWSNPLKKQEESKEKLFEINKMQFSENKPIRSLRDNDESFDRRRRENLELKNSGSMLYKLDASEFVKQETEVHTDKQMNESSVCLKQESESKWEMFNNSRLHFSGSNSAFQRVKICPVEREKKELKPSEIMGVDTFRQLISIWDTYMREDIQNVSNYIHNVIKNYKERNNLDGDDEPIFKFWVKVLQLYKQDASVEPPKNREEAPPLNSIVGDMIVLTQKVKQEVHDP